jgi:patatin-like phospholipase/acyl hydrolase
MENKSFNILSIDGGGIRGIFPAMFLTNVEAELKAKGVEKWQVYHYFKLISGTSTGGILAIGLALGIPAKELFDLYIDNAKIIFGNKRSFFARFKNAAYDRGPLEKLIRETYKKANNGTEPRLDDCKTHVSIPIYDLMEGSPSVLKSRYHPDFVRDYHIPAYQAALATSAAPTYFNPYSSEYTDLNGLTKPFHTKVDGGVFINNPALGNIIESQRGFNIELKDISLLSIGTGHQKFCDTGVVSKKERKNWGIYYWMLQKNKKRLIELFMQGQSQEVQNLISLMQKGIGHSEPDRFTYIRINTELDEKCNIELDETNKSKLDRLAEKANIEFQKNAAVVMKTFFNSIALTKS